MLTASHHEPTNIILPLVRILFWMVFRDFNVGENNNGVLLTTKTRAVHTSFVRVTLLRVRFHL